MTFETLALAALLLGSAPVPLWTVVFVDGTSVVTLSEPRVDGPLAILELPDGQLASVRSERIAQAIQATPRDASEPAPRRQAPAASPERAARRLDNAALNAFVASRPPAPLPAPTGASALTTESRPEQPAPAAEEDLGPRDALGRGPDYWGQRARLHHADVERARAEHAAAVARREEAERNILYGVEVTDGGLGVIHYLESPEERALAFLRLSQVREEADRARVTLETAERELDSLKDEARRAGALPGWLRVP